MGKTFDELFDDFFKSFFRINQNNNKQSISDILSKLGANVKIDEDFEKKLDADLGKPDKIICYNEGGIFYEKRIWHTFGGDLIKLIVTDDPSILLQPPPEKSLQEQLDEAVANENFEKAAAIRDKMNPKKPKANKVVKKTESVKKVKTKRKSKKDLDN